MIKKLFILVVVLFLSLHSIAVGHFIPAYSGNGQNHMNLKLLKATIDEVNLGANDEVAAFDGTLCVGVIILTGSIVIPTYIPFISASQNEPGLSNGFTDGHPITYKFWDSSEAKEISGIIAEYFDPETGLKITAPNYTHDASAFVELSFSNPVNQIPVANAGADQTVDEGTIVTLDGSASSDLDNNDLSYLWTAPEGISLSSTTAVMPTFIAPEVMANTNLIFTLVVNDGTVNSTGDQVVISVIDLDNHWTGALSNNWDAPGNWTLNSVPQQNDDVIIPGSLLNYPNISGSGAVNNIEISAGATLTIAPTGQFYVNGNLINDSGVSGLLIESDGSGTGSLIIKNAGVQAQINRWMTGNKWHHCSSPLNQSTMNFLQNNPNIPTNGASRGMMDFDTEHDQWNSFFTNSSLGDLIASKGFMLRTNADASVNFTGAVNVGTITIETNPLGHRWNCIGNPYSSAIKLTGTEGSIDNFYEVNFDKIDNHYRAIYIWDNSESTPTYTLVNRASPTYYAALAQGFFVKAKSSATGSFQFTQVMQVHQNTIQLKSAKTNDPEIKLLILNNNLKAKTSIKLIEGMSRGLDVGYDAGILKAEPRLSIFTRLVDDVDAEFMLQCLSDQDYHRLKIPVGFDCEAGGTITISAETLNLPDDIRLILEDKDQQKFVDLAKSEYTTTTNPNTVASNRFVLHTSEMTTRINEDAFDNQLKAYVDGNKQLQIVGETGKHAVASMYDVQGRLVLHQKLEAVSEQNVPIKQLAEGIYLLLIRNEGKQQSIKLKIEGK